MKLVILKDLSKTNVKFIIVGFLNLVLKQPINSASIAVSTRKR